MTPDPTPREDDRLVTVCEACLTAACWLGEFYCQGYMDADTVQKTVRELRELGREHPDYWKPERANG